MKQELERVLQGKVFRNTEALKKLLRFIVERTLEGDEASLKEYTLGYQVLKRGADFDPQADPIVRVQAGRLRTKLEDYYAADGKNNNLRIVLPKGGYVPDFISLDAVEPSTAPAQPSTQTRSPLLFVSLAAAAIVLAIAAILLLRPTPVEPRKEVVRVALSPPPDSGFLAFSLHQIRNGSQRSLRSGKERANCGFATWMRLSCVRLPDRKARSTLRRSGLRIAGSLASSLPENLGRSTR